jgi:hypothetical protein
MSQGTASYTVGAKALVALPSDKFNAVAAEEGYHRDEAIGNESRSLAITSLE